jgi:ADP-ribosyl-[dinitrogen reductase] hydrolase
MIDRDRQRGALIGLAVGDALGAPVEFQPPQSFLTVTDYNYGGPFGLEPGQWTDDTSLALALADSLAKAAGTWTIRCGATSLGIRTASTR